MAQFLPLRPLRHQVQFGTSCIETSSAEGRGPASLCDLPYEVMLLILADLELEDHFRLSLTCQHFQFTIRSDSICRVTLRVSSVLSTHAAEN